MTEPAELSPQEMGDFVAACTLLAKFVESQGGQVRPELVAAMRKAGITQLAIGGTDADLGVISLVRAKPAAQVTNEAEFLRWLRRAHPEEVFEVPNPAFQQRLLDASTAAGLPVDPVTGEVPAGVEIVAGTPYVQVRANRKAKELMAEAVVRTRVLALVGALDQPEPAPATVDGEVGTP